MILANGRSKKNVNGNKNSGNVLIVSLILFNIVLTIYFFCVYIIMMQINSIGYNIKEDIFIIGKNAIISMNKKEAADNNYSIDMKSYYEIVKKLIIEIYGLNNNLENKNGIVEKIEIVEIKYYMSHEIDNRTRKILNEPSMHIILKVKIKPLILVNLFQDKFIFDIHNDIKLEFLEVE